MAARGRKPGSMVRGTCNVCSRVELTRGASNFRCSECKTAGRRPPTQRLSAWLGMDEAQAIVGQLVRLGRLPAPQTLGCADCFGPAIEYEHRDYNKPDVVEPICRRCNILRGPAIPLAGAIEALVKRGVVPYRRRFSARRMLEAMGHPSAVLDEMPGKLTNAHWRVICDFLDAITPATPTPAEQGA